MSAVAATQRWPATSHRRTASSEFVNRAGVGAGIGVSQISRSPGIWADEHTAEKVAKISRCARTRGPLVGGPVRQDIARGAGLDSVDRTGSDPARILRGAQEE